MAKYTTQLEYRFHDDGHWWFGRDRISGGLMVGNKDFQESLKEAKKQLKSAIRQVDLQGTPKCTQSDEELEAAGKVAGRMMTLWQIDEFM